MYILRSFLLTLLLGWSIHALAAELPDHLGASARVLIVASAEASPQASPQATVRASFLAYLRERGLAVEAHLIILNASATAPRLVQQFLPDLIFVQGDRAAAWVRREIPGIPTVVAMAVDRQTLERDRYATGVLLGFSLPTQLHWISAALPAARRVGLLYHTDANRRRLPRLRALATASGIELVAVEVAAPKDLPAALNDLLSRVDVLLGMPDDLVLTPQTAKSILLTSFRKKVPFVGPSPNWTQAGALYSLGWSYRDMGRQCGQQAERLLRGATVASVPLEAPRTAVLSLNLKAAHHMNITIPDAVRQRALQVYE